MTSTTPPGGGAGPGGAAQPPPGTRSPDGAWEWDGQVWRAVTASGAPPQYGAPPQFGAPGTPPPQYGAPPQYGTPPQFGAPPYGAPGTPPPPYGAYAYGTRAGPAPGLVYGGFWIRFLAILIDGIVLSIIDAIIGGPTVGLSHVDPATGQTVINSGWYGLNFLTGLVYYVAFWGTTGQTLGMMALRLRVVRLDDGDGIGIATAVVRYIGLIVSSIPLGLGLIWAAFDPRKQGWHDKMAGTVVVRRIA